MYGNENESHQKYHMIQLISRQVSEDGTCRIYIQTATDTPTYSILLVECLLKYLFQVPVLNILITHFTIKHFILGLFNDIFQTTKVI
jgi:hypothetical protein